MIQLGDTVKDKVSGFKGVTVCRCEWLMGCTRWVVQPPVGKDGKLPDSAALDEGQLEVTRKGTGRPAQPETGGPMPVPARGDEVRR